MITNIHSPTWLCLTPGIIAIGGQTLAIFNGFVGSPNKVCQIDSVTFRHATQLGELKIPCCHTPPGKAIYVINSHWNVVTHLAWYRFYILCQNLVVIVWGTWYVCQSLCSSRLSGWVERLKWGEPNLVVSRKKEMVCCFLDLHKDHIMSIAKGLRFRLSLCSHVFSWLHRCAILVVLWSDKDLQSIASQFMALNHV